METVTKGGGVIVSPEARSPAPCIIPNGREWRGRAATAPCVRPLTDEVPRGVAATVVDLLTLRTCSKTDPIPTLFRGGMIKPLVT